MDRFLEGEVELDIAPYAIEVLSEDEIKVRSSEGGFPYFSLSEAEVGETEATLSLELRWMPGEAEEGPGEVRFGGGGVRVKFEQVAGEWQAPAGAIATWIS